MDLSFGFSRLGDFASPGYDIIILAGQSNMVGRNGPVDPVLDSTNDRIYQYGNSTGTITQASDPLDHWDETANTVGMGMSFAKQYLPYLASNRNILLIPAADGGTGFSTGHWAVSGAAREWVKTAANAVINSAAEDEEHRVVAILWHQGETDRSYSQSQYTDALDTLIAEYRANITGASNVPFIVGEVPSWSTQYGAGVAASLLDITDRVKYTAFVSTSDLTDGGDSLHFDAASQRTLGARYYSQLATATSNAPNVPDAISSINTSANDSSVTLSWSTPSSNRSEITDYVVRYKESINSEWSIYSDGVSTNPSATISGLTNDVSYDFQIATLSDVGMSVYSTTVSETPTVSISNSEQAAARHWLLGNDNSGMTDMVSGIALTQNNAASTPSHNAGYLTLPAGTSVGLNSDLNHSAEYTVVIVAKQNRTANTDKGVLFGGAFSPTAGAAVYLQNGTTPILNFNYRGVTLYTHGEVPDNTWIFAALSIKSTVNGYFVGNQPLPNYGELGGNVNSATIPICIGSSSYSNIDFESSLDVAEFIIFPTALTQSELQDVYQRSVTRLSERGVALS
jgi:hypothetical protein